MTAEGGLQRDAVVLVCVLAVLTSVLALAAATQSLWVYPLGVRVRLPIQQYATDHLQVRGAETGLIAFGGVQPESLGFAGGKLTIYSPSWDEIPTAVPDRYPGTLSVDGTVVARASLLGENWTEDPEDLGFVYEGRDFRQIGERIIAGEIAELWWPTLGCLFAVALGVWLVTRVRSRRRRSSSAPAPAPEART